MVEKTLPDVSLISELSQCPTANIDTYIGPQPFNLTESVQGRKVFIKVGVLNPEARLKDQFWIEFDPTVAQDITKDRLLLPYVVTPSSKGLVAFYTHTNGGCSSLLLPKGNSSAAEEYTKAGMALCNNFVASSPSSTWKLWDRNIDDEEQYRNSFGMSISACHRCSSIEFIRAVRRFPAIPLKTVVQWFTSIELLDIDAQGLDVTLLLSLQKYVERIRQFKLECQALKTSTEPMPYIYDHTIGLREGVENDCKTAEDFLVAAGFECRYEINNCGCAEYNLYCSKGAS